MDAIMKRTAGLTGQERGVPQQLCAGPRGAVVLDEGTLRHRAQFSDGFYNMLYM